jgi:putative ABC transport system permease protein
MLRFTPLIVKTLWRHRSRTILTVSGAAVALFVFCFLGSIQEGINALRERQESKGSLIVFQANKFCPATSHLPQDYSRQIAGINGVRDSVPIQVFTNNCRASLDVVVFYGLPPKQLRDVRNMQLLSGDWSAFQRHQDSAVVGRSIAQRRGIRVGDTFSIGQLSVNVAGVFSSTDPAEENYVYCHLDFLQRSNGVDLVGTVTQFEVLLDPGVNALEVCNSIDDRFRNGSVETHTSSQGSLSGSEPWRPRSVDRDGTFRWLLLCRPGIGAGGNNNRDVRPRSRHGTRRPANHWFLRPSDLQFCVDGEHSLESGRRHSWSRLGAPDTAFQQPLVGC